MNPERMKNIFLLISLPLLIFSFCQQDGISWKVTFGNKKLLTATEENQNKNIVSIRSADLDQPGRYFTLSYREMNSISKKNGWKRSIIIFDESDNQLIKKDSTAISLSANELKNLFKERKKIKLFTISIPSDPSQAALVRIRRVHLCTLELK